jgi:hypothetical protein
MVKLITPVFPFFEMQCVQCNRRTDSLHAACGTEPFTYMGTCCLNDADREAVRLHSNAQVVACKAAQPAQLAHARRVMGIKRPANVPMDPSWEGCGVKL